MSQILTHRGILFDPIHPKAELIDIEDIAHALALLCRANGHFRSFYSVGMHCINCAAEAAARGYDRQVQLACLLHDASEAYLSDVTRPVKQVLPQYLQIEAPLQEMIWEKWLGHPLEEDQRVKVFEIDDAVLYYEFENLMGAKLVEDPPALMTVPDCEFSGFRQTEDQFLTCFRKLTEENV